MRYFIAQIQQSNQLNNQLNMSQTMKGTVSKLFDEVEKNNFKTREFLVDYKSGNYDKKAVFKLMGKSVGIAENLNVGDQVDVFYNPESSEWNGRWFTNNIAWKVNVLADGVAKAVKPQEEFDSYEPIGDDEPLPF